VRKKKKSGGAREWWGTYTRTSSSCGFLGIGRVEFIQMRRAVEKGEMGGGGQEREEERGGPGRQKGKEGPGGGVEARS